MALEKKLLGLPMAKGLNKKVTDRVLPAGEFTALENVQVVEGGEIRKRLGFHALSPTVSPVSPTTAAETRRIGKSVAAYNDEIIVFDGASAHSKNAYDTWVDKGRIVGCNLETELVEAGTTLVQTAAHIARAKTFEVHCWSELDPTETVTVTNTISSIATPGGNYGTINCGSDHNVSVGGKVTLEFDAAHFDDSPPDYLVTSITDENTFVIDYGKTFSGSTTTGTVELVNGVVWRTYVKVIDTTTNAEIVGKSLINVFSTHNSMYNIPRAQVASVHNRYIFAFVHVGSGRVKSVKIDTGAGLGEVSTNLNPSPSILTNTSSDVLFHVDMTIPDWCIETVNNATIEDSFCVFRRLTDGTQRLRLEYFSCDGNGDITVSTAATAVEIDTEPHYPPSYLTSVTGYPNETYPGAGNKSQLGIVGGIMLKVITPSDSRRGDYIAIGYTSSDDMTAADLNRGGSADEPNGIKLRVYNAGFTLQGEEQTVRIDGTSTEFASTSAPGFILMNGTAGKNHATNVRFFLTMVANKTNDKGRSPNHLVNAYDYALGGGITDVDLDLYGLTITTDCFAYKFDLFLGVAHATRPNSVGSTGDLALSTFNTSVGMIIDQQGQVVAKTGLSAGPWSQEIDTRFTQYDSYGRLHFMYGVGRVVPIDDTRVLTGSIDPTVSTGVTGVGTKFFEEIERGDLITASVVTRQFLYATSDTGGVVGTAFTDVANDTSPEVHKTSKFRFGYSRYSGVCLDNDGTDLTAMDAAVGTFDLNPDRYLPSVQANGSLKVAGGILWDYSGDYFKEDNFFYYPELHSVDVSTNSGTFDATTGYSYCATYEWIDHNGKVMRSAPSSPITTGSFTNFTPQIKVYNLHMTYKRDVSVLVNAQGYTAVNWGDRSEVKIVLYRTEDGKGIFYRCAEVRMDYSGRYQTIDDELSDTNLIDNPVLYTTGGRAPHVAPPSLYDIAVWKDRVWLATTENTVWFSKRFTESDETGFSDSFIRSVDNRAEKVHALCPNLEHILILGARNGYYLSGDGPSDTGAGPGFSPLRVFGPGQGAVEGSCRVESPLGVFYQTRQGLMLVGRNMQMTYKGAKAEGTYSPTDRLIDAHVYEDNHEIRFTGADTILVYNYVFDLWSTWTLAAGGGFHENVRSIVVGGAHYRLNTTGVLYKQVTDNTETGAWNDKISLLYGYAFKFTTGWMNMGSVQQLGRVYRLLFLGDYNAVTKPQLLLSTDYDEAITTVEMDAAPGTSKFQLVSKLPKQKVKALKFSLTETVTGTDVASGDFRVQAMSMLVGLKKPETSFKFPTANHIS